MSKMYLDILAGTWQCYIDFCTLQLINKLVCVFEFTWIAEIDPARPLTDAGNSPLNMYRVFQIPWKFRKTCISALGGSIFEISGSFCPKCL